MTEQPAITDRILIQRQHDGLWFLATAEGVTPDLTPFEAAWHAEVYMKGVQ